MMDRSRSNRDRDTASAGGRSLHTYTPRSHEDLLRSHLQLDASRNARLQNELQKLADENKKLRRNLDEAKKDLKDQEDEIENLKNKLREKPRTQSPPRTSPLPQDLRTLEVDGKPLSLEQIISHFEGVIDKHHALLDKKNKQIEDLEDALRNRPERPDRKSAAVQPIRGEDYSNPDDIAKELALIRKEYQQVETILTERNNNLENLIEELKNKLDQYAAEIARLREELATKGTGPDESTMRLLKEKEKENDYLKDLIDSLKNRQFVTDQQPPLRRRSSDPSRYDEPPQKIRSRYDERPPRRKSSDPSRYDEIHYDRYYDDEPRKSRSFEPTPESSLKSFRPVAYRPVTPEVSFRQLPATRDRPKGRLYPEIPSETDSVSPKRKRHPVCEACGEEYPSRHEDLPERQRGPIRTSHSHPAHLEKPKKPKKKGCCGGKGSQTSNVPYEKAPDKGMPPEGSPDYEKPPGDEEVLYVHRPKRKGFSAKFHREPKHKEDRSSRDSSPSDRRPNTPDESPGKPKHKLISKLRPDQK